MWVALAWALAVLTSMPSFASAQTPVLQTPVLPRSPVPLLGPLALRVEVIADEPSGPPPGGTVALSTRLGLLLSRPVTNTTDLAVAGTALAATGLQPTVRYSGDEHYEASDPVPVVVASKGPITIVARSRDTAAPAIEILSPGDGVRYSVGESVVAVYACKDPAERSAVTRCEGPVPPGAAVDTTTAGRFSFVVASADARGNTTTATSTFQVAGTAGDTGPALPVRSEPGNAAPPAPPVAPPIAASAATAARPRSGPARASARRGRAARPRSTTGGSPSTTTGSAGDNAVKPVRQELAPFDPRSNPEQTIGILVAAFTLLQLARGGAGLAIAGGGGGVGRSASRRRVAAGRRSHARAGKDQDSAPEASFDYEAVEVEQLVGGAAVLAIGDRSRTWGWPGTTAIDALGAALPARLAHRSPLLARVTADGTYLRAIFGSASLLGPFAGLALGLLAVRDTGGGAVPPIAAVTIAITVIGVLDATAGFVAVLSFAIGVLVLGGIDSEAHLRLMLGLGALWFVVPVLAGAARPLRREPARSLEESWDRAADFVIASLIGAWAVQKIVLALPGLAGEELALTAYANTAAYWVLAALLVRLCLETLAAHLYPRRLDIAEPGDLPEPSRALRLGATALRTLIFVFFARIVVGTGWQLWAGAALFVTPQILAVYEERVPNSPGLFRALPKGLVELVLMLVVGTVVGALLIGTLDEHAETFVANGFVLLALPGFLLSLLQLFGRDGHEPAIGWGKRVAGVGLLVGGVLVALGLL